MADEAYNIEEASFTDAGLSDDFDSPTLGSQWIVDEGVLGTVDLLGTPTDNIYDLTTRPGTLFLQPAKNGIITIRLESIPAAGEQFVLALSVGGNDQNVFSNSKEIRTAINTSSSEISNPRLILFYSGQRFPEIIANEPFNSYLGSNPQGRRIYFRYVRVGDQGYSMYSTNGVLWKVTGNRSVDSFWTNFWISVENSSSNGSVNPIHAVHWFRHTPYNGLLAF